MFRKKVLKRDVYACKTGDYAGQMFIIISESKDFIECLSIPEVKNVKIPLESFDFGRNSGIIETRRIRKGFPTGGSETN